MAAEDTRGLKNSYPISVQAEVLLLSFWYCYYTVVLSLIPILILIVL